MDDDDDDEDLVLNVFNALFRNFWRASFVNSPLCTNGCGGDVTDSNGGITSTVGNFLKKITVSKFG